MLSPPLSPPLDIIPYKEYTNSMWEVEYTDEFETWWETLNEAEQAVIGFMRR